MELKTNTAVRITVGPFLDKTDGITPEVALTATNEHLTLMVDTSGVPTLVLDANATASGGNNDMVHVTNDDAGYYDLELTAAQLNYLGNAKLSINYVTDHCPVFQEISIVSAAYWDNKYGTGNINADVIAISGDTTAADNLEAACDGTTYNIGGGAVVAASCTASTPALIADAVCDEVISTGHATANSLAKIIYDNVNAPIATVDTVVDTLTTNLADLHTDVGTAITDIAAVHVHVGTIDGHITADYTSTEKAAIDLLDDADGGLGDIHTVVNGISASAIADAVCDEVISTGHSTANSLAKIIYDNVNAPLNTIDTVVDGIEIHVHATDGHITADYGATEKSAIDLLDDASGGLADIHTDVADLHTDLADVHTDVGTAIGYIDTEVAAIKTQTDKLAFTVANKVDCNVYTWNGTAVATPATAGIPDVNMKNIANAAVSTTTAQIGVNTVQISGDATAADNEESFFDGTGYAGTNNVMPTTTNVTNGVTVSVGTGTGQINVASGKVPATIAVGDLAANSLTASALATDAVDEIADGVWNEATSGHTTEGSTCKALTDDLAFGAPPTVAAIADAVCDEVISTGHAVANSLGKIVYDNLNAPVATVDTVVDGLATELAKVPKSDSNVTWNNTALASINAEVDTALNTAIPGTPTSDSINERIAALDGHVTADYGSTEKTAIDLLDDASGGLADIHSDIADVPTASENADALLNRDMSAVSDTNARSPLNALRLLRNKWTITGNTLSVKKENDSTEAWNSTVSASSDADPIVGNDPS
jgi:hypothetical protein